jgi:hypothetical protein
MKLLSVDWDYFFPDLAWMDWGHNETALMIQHIWSLRCGDWNLKTKQSALDYVQPDRKLLGQFWHRVLRGSSRFQLLVAESHAELARWIVDSKMTVDILDNYDQHHDCGYSVVRSDDNRQQYERVDCGEWVPYLVDTRRIGEYQLHYPAWRRQLPERDRKELELRIIKTCNGSWDYGPPKHPTKYDAVFICRSGGWTPPWCDEEFNKFVESIFKFKVGKWEMRFAGGPNDLGVPVGTRHPNMLEATALRKQFLEQRHKMAEQQLSDNAQLDSLAFISSKKNNS